MLPIERKMIAYSLWFGMSTQFQSNLGYDRLVWLCALPGPQRGPTRRVIEDVGALAERSGTAFRAYFPRSAFEFKGYLSAEKETGGNPLLHIDSHGVPDGIAIGPDNDVLHWKEVCNAIRPININSENHTLVVSNCCFSAVGALDAISIKEPTPFLGLLGPIDEFLVGDFEKTIPAFYRSFFEQDNLVTAIRKLRGFDFWLADQFLLQTLVYFLRMEAVGKGKSRHVEELLSKARATGKILLNEPIASVRKQIKERLAHETGPKLLESHVDRFLFGSKPPYSYEDIMEIVRRAP